MTGYVYVIVAKNRNAVKIGISKNHPERRVRQLQTGSPDSLYVYAARKVKDYRAVETEVHRRLRARRVSGEWFTVSPATALSVVDAVIAEHRRPLPFELRRVIGVIFPIAIFAFLWYTTGDPVTMAVVAAVIALASIRGMRAD